MIILYDGRWTTKLMNCNLLCNHVSDFVINERYEADFNSFIRHRRVMILLLLSSGLFIVYHQQIIYNSFNFKIFLVFTSWYKILNYKDKQVLNST